MDNSILFNTQKDCVSTLVKPHWITAPKRKQRYGKNLEAWRYIWIKGTTIHKDKFQSSQQYRIYEVSE